MQGPVMTRTKSAWSRELDQHLAVLRSMLRQHKKLWSEIGQMAEVGIHAIPGFVGNRRTQNNPTVRQLRRMADALDACLHMEE